MIIVQKMKNQKVRKLGSLTQNALKKLICTDEDLANAEEAF
jgi:hypothetical protein